MISVVSYNDPQETLVHHLDVLFQGSNKPSGVDIVTYTYYPTNPEDTKPVWQFELYLEGDARSVYDYRVEFLTQLFENLGYAYSETQGTFRFLPPTVIRSLKKAHAEYKAA